MSVETFCLSVANYKQRALSFLKQESSNLYLIVKNKLYPVHKEFLDDSKFLKNQINSLQSTLCVIEKDLDVKIFEKILGFLYGLNFQCCRDWEIIKILEIVQFLEIQILKQLIFEDIEKNCDDYCIFVLLTIAYKFKVHWLQQICIDHLIDMQFEQINYNRYEFLQCDRQIVEQLLKFIIKFQKQRNIIIFEYQNFKQIINQYNQLKNSHININQLLIPVEQIIAQIGSQYQRSSVNTDSDYNSLSFLGVKNFGDKPNKSRKYSTNWIQEIQDQSQESISFCHQGNDDINKSSNKKKTFSNQQKTASISSFKVRKLYSSFQSYVNCFLSEKNQHQLNNNTNGCITHNEKTTPVRSQFTNSFQMDSPTKIFKVRKIYSTAQFPNYNREQDKSQNKTLDCTLISN